MSISMVGRALAEANAVTNCPFYGRHLFSPQPVMRGGAPFLLIASSGNQCAIATDGYTPCIYDLQYSEIDWRICPRVKDVRL